MILLDFSQIAISSILYNKEARTNLDENKTREIVLNILRKYNMMFRDKYGDLIICCDARTKNWRKTVFPQYKAVRKMNRESSDINWQAIFTILNRVKEEMYTYMPYKIIEVNGMEGDDVIATLAQHYDERTMIVSSDEDYVQLHNDKVKQYSLRHKKQLKVDDIDFFKFEHIAKGDVSDGIPNILSNSNCFINKERQKTITGKKLNLWYNEGLPKDEEIQKNWKRNELLIDLTKTPLELVKECKEEFEDFEVNNRKQLYKYFKEKRLVDFLDKTKDF